MDGREKTLAYIERWDIRDSSGRLHAPHGIWTWQARLTAYVAFDDHPKLGRRVWYLFTASLQKFADRWANKRPDLASLPDCAVKNTGAGTLWGPQDLDWFKECSIFIDRVEPFEIEPHLESPANAVNLVDQQLRRRHPPFASLRRASRAEERNGIDIIAVDPHRRYGVEECGIEVKSRARHQNLPSFFVQISETNPENCI